MEFKTDIQIAQECQMAPITEIAAKAGIDDKYLEQYGKYKAKIDYNLLRETDKKDGKKIIRQQITDRLTNARRRPPEGGRRRCVKMIEVCTETLTWRAR